MSSYSSPDGITPFPQGRFVTACIDLMSKRTKDGVFIRLFYPTSLKNIESHSSCWTPWYLGDTYSSALAKIYSPKFPTLLRSLLYWQTGSSFIPSVWEGAFIENIFPVVLFSHGMHAHRNMYSAVCSDICSYGFIVASIEHRDGSACTTFTLSDQNEKIWHEYEHLLPDQKEIPIRSRQIEMRAKECSRTLDFLYELNAGTASNELNNDFDLSVFKNHLDLSKPILVGHSFGGTTVIVTLEEDQRFKLGVGLDPWMLPLKDNLMRIKSNMKQPFLSILTEGFLSDVNLCSLEIIMSSNTSNILIRGTVHQSQSDVPFVTGILGQLTKMSGAKIDRHLAMTINNQLVIEFICNKLGLNIERPAADVNNILKNCSFGMPPVSMDTDESMDYLRQNKIIIEH